jgi:hypothetical protein
LQSRRAAPRAATQPAHAEKGGEALRLPNLFPRLLTGFSRREPRRHKKGRKVTPEARAVRPRRARGSAPARLRGIRRRVRVLRRE